ncbi:hypothetical protein [Risungbinella massiliensis]|uniref:hypothetical protein n=1 Tax=Risungbinella massiliensis TaxID=1329796 RepID=UPI0005CBC667|nr:hypothetical protein [Risungbinella massiliensis]
MRFMNLLPIIVLLFLLAGCRSDILAIVSTSNTGQSSSSFNSDSQKNSNSDPNSQSVSIPVNQKPILADAKEIDFIKNHKPIIVGTITKANFTSTSANNSDGREIAKIDLTSIFIEEVPNKPDSGKKGTIHTNRETKYFVEKNGKLYVGIPFELQEGQKVSVWSTQEVMTAIYPLETDGKYIVYEVSN